MPKRLEVARPFFDAGTELQFASSVARRKATMLNEKQIHPYPVHGCNKSDQLYEFLVQLPLKATNWEHFVQVRLLVTGAEGEERAFEVAHPLQQGDIARRPEKSLRGFEDRQIKLRPQVPDSRQRLWH